MREPPKTADFIVTYVSASRDVETVVEHIDRMSRIYTEGKLCGRTDSTDYYPRRFHASDYDYFASGHVDRPIMVT